MNFYSFQIQELYKNNNFTFSTNYIYNSCINCASNEEQMKTFANASKIDLNSICDVCTDVKNTHNREGTRFQTHHHLVFYYHGGGGKVLFIEKEK